MSGQSAINNEDKVEQLNIFYKGNDYKLSGQGEIYGSLYAEKAN